MQGFTFTRKQSASNKTPRQINRNLVFNLVRMRQPISRAELARVSGLQRSTVSLIVEDLIAGRWISEGSTGRLPRGRRPTFLQVNDRRAVIAVDIHPGQTTVAVADLAGRIVAQSIVSAAGGKKLSAVGKKLAGDSTKRAADGKKRADEGKEEMAAIVNVIRKMIADHKDRSFDGIGISIPGRADEQQQRLVFAPNLNWRVTDIKAKIARATGLRVEMDNVANACVLSEVWFGDTDGSHDLVVVNVSEGIGTGIFVNGKLLRGEGGMAGEFGHVELETDGPLCACGKRGCWETLASNRAALRYYHELGGKAVRTGELSFDGLLKLAQGGDRKAAQALEQMSCYLGRGMRMIASALAPHEIIVVGDITMAWHVFGPMVDAEFRKNSLSRGPVLRPAYEANVARLRSAVAQVWHERPI
jgi:predicted NBD/HSP70 family sugar kinase